MTSAGLMFIALAIDAVVGWPRPLFQLIGHPVTWLGALIARLDHWLNIDGTEPGARKIAGLISALLVIAVAAAVGMVLSWALPDGLTGVLLGAVLAWPLLAARSLYSHVADVARPLAAGDLGGARQAIAQIVGRDPEGLDEAGLARAALESLAENASDAVIAPLFWGLLLGLPGLFAYKAINTLDSMIGHKTPRHQEFGWASARIDDAANLLPARLTGLLFAIVSPHPRDALETMLRDARHHRSPNGGWPEAALASALGVRLSGPRAYHGQMSDEPWINGQAHDPDSGDLTRGLRLYRTMVGLFAAFLAILWLL